MTGLGALVRGLAAREGVRAVLLVSGDGLPIEHTAGSPVEAETMAALAATLGRHADRLGEDAGPGEFRSAVLEYAGGLVVLARAGNGNWLTLLTGPDADIGALLYDLRYHRTALAQLL